MNTTLRVGTISHGTMREEDLIPAFTAALFEVNPELAAEIQAKHGSAYDSLGNAELTDEEMEDQVHLLHEVLWEALQDHCPREHYFGSHPGDGSDYGVWPCDME